MAGFPHLYYYGNPRVPARFLKNAVWNIRRNGGRKKMLKYSYPLVLGFILDFVFGDPRWLYHPICVIGNLIALLEKKDTKGFFRKNGGELDRRLSEVVLVCLSFSGVPALGML